MELIETWLTRALLTETYYVSNVRDWIEPEVSTSYFQSYCEFTERFTTGDLESQESSRGELAGFRWN